MSVICDVHAVNLINIITSTSKDKDEGSVVKGEDNHWEEQY